MKRLSAFLPALSLALACQGGNLLFNSSFELGDKGYSGLRRCKVENACDFKYSGAPLAVDTTVSAHGKASIRMDNPNADILRFSTHEFQIVPGNTYTLSFWVKSDRDNYPFRTLFVSRGWSWWGKGANSLISSAGREWKRVSLSFTTPKENIKAEEFNGVMDRYYAAIETGRTFKGLKSMWEPNADLFSSPGTLWIDGMQVEEGALSDYAPAAPVEAAAYSTEIVTAPKPICGELKTVSYLERKTDFAIGVSLFDRHYSKTLETLNFNFDLRPGEVASRRFTFTADKLGGFEVRSSLSDSNSLYKSMAVLTRVAQKRRGGDGYFTLGTTGSIDNIGAFAAAGKVPVYADRFGSPDEWKGILETIDSPIWRAHDRSFIVWKDIEPEKGKFNWEEADRCVEIAERSGMKVCPNFLNGGFDKTTTPEWARLRDRFNPEGTEFPELKVSFSPAIPKTNLPQLEDWADYVRAVTTRYKGRIYAYQDCNEPYFMLPPKYYVEYLKVAYEEIKKADPNAIVLGVCTTEDKMAMANDFLRKCLKLEAADYCDAITFHPYEANMDDSRNSAMNCIAELKAATREETGHDKPLWMDECYYLRTGWVSLRDKFWQVYDWEDSAIARRCLIDLGEGCLASTPTDVPSFFRPEIQPWTDMFSWGQTYSARRQPSEKFAAFCATSDFLNGAEPVKRVMLPGAMCYVFKNRGKVWAAIWSLKYGGIASMTEPEDCKLDIYDVMGNSIGKGLSNVTLELDRNPRYIEWNFPGSLLGLLERPLQEQSELTVKSLEGVKILTISSTALYRKDGKWTLSASLMNAGASSMANTTLKVSSPSLEEQPEPIVFKEIGPGRTESAEIAVSLKPDVKKVPVDLSLSSGGISAELKAELRPVDALDVYSGVMTPPVPIRKTVVGKVDSDKDMSASFQASYEGGTLILNVKVKDEIAGENFEKSPYNSDCIELFIDAMPWDAAGRHFHQVFVLPRNPEGKRVSVAGGKKLDVKESIRILPDGYEAEIKIDLSPKALGRPWLKDAPIKFDIAIDDSDAKDRKSQTVWTGSAGNYGDREGLGVLQFKRTGKARIDLRLNGKLVRHDIDVPLTPAWRTLSFDFTPEESGRLDIRLMSGWHPDLKDHYWVHYRNAVAGDAEIVKGETKATHNKFFMRQLNVEAGKPIHFSYEARADEPLEPAFAQ